MGMASGGNKDAGDARASGRKERRRSRWHWLWKLPLLLVLVSVLQVLVLRFVDPPFTSFMPIRQFEALAAGDMTFRGAYDWRDLEDIAPSLPLAAVAAEDQHFARHRGFDLDAIERALQHNAGGRRIRGGSTISQQLAK